ncbi:MAG TPA: hypothetical protein PLD99_01735 [Parcubacteria group bacterium]|nr:hypothetical protein [Parcubacteria group bacterium]
MRAAMISYNTFVAGNENGWKNQGDNNLLLLQNADGNMWGTSQFGKTAEQWNDETKSLIDPLWADLERELASLDVVVFYVGSYGAERIIELAAEHGLTPDRAVFVFCDCNMEKKSEVLRARGFENSRVIDCECGGHTTMRRVYTEILRYGRVLD